MVDTIKPKLTGAQRMVYEMGHAIGKYRLGTARQPEQIKLDIVCLINDYLELVVKDFDSNVFFKACGYSDRIK